MQLVLLLVQVKLLLQQKLQKQTGPRAAALAARADQPHLQQLLLRHLAVMLCW
jgi:hypothetical protein